MSNCFIAASSRQRYIALTKVGQVRWALLARVFRAYIGAHSRHVCFMTQASPGGPPPGSDRERIMSTTIPLMPKATAVWLVENTSLSFEQIAEFCGLHPLEVKAIADGEVGARHQGHGPDHDRPADPRGDRRGPRSDPEPSAEAGRSQGARAESQAQGPALHAAVAAPGPARTPSSGWCATIPN